jgi:hypothetical protein
MVLERGASLSCRDDGAEFDETTAIAQLQGESDGELAERVLSRLALAERGGHSFEAALLVVSERGSGSARRLIGLGLAAHSTTRELAIIAPPGASPELREELLQLTDELLFGAERALPVRLCFDATVRDPELRSGTFWCVPESE